MIESGSAVSALMFLGNAPEEDSIPDDSEGCTNVVIRQV
jgi:hypothetical protein